MHLVQFFSRRSMTTPAKPLPKGHTSIRRELTERFGGVTAFTSTPAEGLWTAKGMDADEIVVLEVMTSTSTTNFGQAIAQRLRCFQGEAHHVPRAGHRPPPDRHGTD
jgi:hypothetical protein